MLFTQICDRIPSLPVYRSEKRYERQIYGVQGYLTLLGQVFFEESEQILDRGASLNLYTSIELPEGAIQVGIGEINNAMTNRVLCSLAHHAVHNGTNGALPMSGHKIQCLTKINDQMVRQNRHITKYPIDLDLQARGAGNEYGDEAIVSMGTQPPIRRPGIVVHKVQKGRALACGVAARGATP